MATLFHKTPYDVKLVPLIDREGRNVLVVIVKGTFAIRPQGGLQLAPEQEPVRFVDEFVAEPGTSDPRIPSDLVDVKPGTDVILIRPEGDVKQSPLRGRSFHVSVGPVSIAGHIDVPWRYGPLRRDEPPRVQYAGTYDQMWAENRMPLLPEDFDPRHNQAAPPNQIATRHLSGDERVTIRNLYWDTPKTLELNLPGRAVIVSGNVQHDYFTHVAVLDTVLVWLDKPQLVLVWRDVIRCRQKIEEVQNVNVYDVRIASARQLYGAP